MAKVGTQVKAAKVVTKFFKKKFLNINVIDKMIRLSEDLCTVSLIAFDENNRKP